MRPFDAEELVRSLVEDGGWLLIGDSMTESEYLSFFCFRFLRVFPPCIGWKEKILGFFVDWDCRALRHRD